MSGDQKHTPGVGSPIPLSPIGIDGEFMRSHEIARKLRISQKLVLRLFRARKLPGFKIGRTWVCSRAQLEEYIRSLAARIGGFGG